ncbi:multicopper oxidase domain-containing protein [Jiella sp. MQZ13P-4]|uniref:Multicopper oxidase domain-containing protein n=2 Tax=Jiella sonneratiae TaxID=2816856 RepID=A0ABS3J3X4_9HYPH|nr:multicopper oxidase domain-containing protein [Jiella sonneratiae]
MRLTVKLKASGEETPLDVSEGAWVFTVNGQDYPDITVAPGASEVWRIQNASANITYRLRLSEISPSGRTNLGNLKFAVLQMDGATPVHLDANAGTGGSDALAAPQTEEILLMPGSRAELGIVSPQPEADLTYQLVAGPFQAGFTRDSADTWPRIALARVHFLANAPAAAPAQAAPAGTALVARNESAPGRAAPAREASLDDRLAGVFRIQPQAMPQRETLRRNQSRIATLQEKAQETARQPGASRYAPTYEASPANFCSDLAGLERWSLEQKAHPDQEIVRRIYFGIQETPDGEFFLLGETFLNQATGQEWNGKGQTIDYSGGRPVVPVTLSTFDPAAGPCAYKVDSPDAAETWELVNLSPEVHNFHIHQLKYRVRRDPKSGALFYRAPSPLDAVEIPASLAINTQTVDLQHDTIIVPRGTDTCSDIFTEVEPVSHEEGAVHRFSLDPKGKSCRGDGAAGDESGMIQLDMAFSGGQFASFPDPADPARLDPATFVLHCHILEHEDNGMMQRISVIDPKVADPGAAQSRLR